MPYVTLIKTSEHGIVLNLDANGGVLAADTEEKMVGQWEAAYEEMMGRGLTWATSATIHWLMFQPSGVEIGGIEELRKRFFGDEENAAACRMRSIAGSLDVARIPNQATALCAWNDGAKPRLVEEEEEEGRKQ